eukprot:3027394-Pyramimonas_sp.AAC.1
MKRAAWRELLEGAKRCSQCSASPTGPARAEAHVARLEWRASHAASPEREQVASGQLEDDAREGPHVRRRGVLGAHDDLRAAVLPRLDVAGELLVRPARVPKVHYFAVELQQLLHVQPGGARVHPPP